MPKKTPPPLSELKNEIKGCMSLALEIKAHVSSEEPFINSAGEIYVPPLHGNFDATPKPTGEVSAEFAAAYDEHEARLELKEEINLLDSQKPRNIDEMVKKRDLLNDLRTELAQIDGNKTEDDKKKNASGKDAESFIRSLRISYMVD